MRRTTDLMENVSIDSENIKFELKFQDYKDCSAIETLLTK